MNTFANEKPEIEESVDPSDPYPLPGVELELNISYREAKQRLNQREELKKIIHMQNQNSGLITKPP